MLVSLGTLLLTCFCGAHLRIQLGVHCHHQSREHCLQVPVLLIAGLGHDLHLLTAGAGGLLKQRGLARTGLGQSALEQQLALLIPSFDGAELYVQLPRQPAHQLIETRLQLLLALIS
ncbi:hypothetical protein D3C77_322980 [compost metagenome]